MNLFNSKVAKVTSVAVGVLVAFAFVLSVAPANVSAATCTFTRDLFLGVSSGEDVRCLQQGLNSMGFTVAASGAGSMNNETTFFGSRTVAAVKAFQMAKGITPVAGYFGPKSRAAWSGAAMGGGTVTPGNLPAGCTSTVGFSPTTGARCDSGTVMVPTVGGALVVSAGAQPVNSLAPQSAARVPFTTVTFTAGSTDVKVDGVVVRRTGLAQNAVFAGVVLVGSDGIQFGTAKTFNSNNEATLDAGFTIPAGQSRTFTVSGNMAASLSSYAGQVASIAVVGVNSAATVSGPLPINGAAHTINASLSLGSGTFYISTFDPNNTSTVSKEVGTTGYRFSGIRVAAGSAEAVRLWSVRWYQSGSAGASDLANVVTVVNGVQYPTVVSADGKYYTSTFGSGVVIDKGNSLDLYVQGDIIGAGSAGRTIQFDIFKNTDVYMTGETYLYGITGTANSTASAGAGSQFTTSTPFYDASTASIAAGSATSITKANTVASQNVAVNVPNQVLGGFITDIKGEPISVQSMAFTISTSSTGVGLITNVSIYDQNGAVVAGPVDASGAGATLTFTDTVTFPIGPRTYTIKGKLPTTFTDGGSVYLSTNPSSNWSNITGQVTGNTISLSSNGNFAMNTMTVRAGALAITAGADPVAQTVVGGGLKRLLTNIQFDASRSGEDLRFSSLPTTLTPGGFAGTSDLTGCQLYDGATALNTTTIVNPTSATTSAAAYTFTLDNAFTIPKGTVKVLAIKCNVSSTALSSATFAWGMTSTQIGALSVTGVTSSNTVTATGSTFAGNTQTIGTGSFAVSTDASSLGYTVVAANQTGLNAGTIKFRSTNEAHNLQRIGLTLTNTASSSASDLVMVSIWDGATRVGTAVFTGSNTAATSTLDTQVLLPKDQDKTLTLKVDLAQIGPSSSAVDGHLIAVDVNSTDTTATQGPGVDSGVMHNFSGSTAFAGLRMFKTYPTVALESGSGLLPATGVSDGRLIRFRVTANSAGPVGIAKIAVGISTTSSSATPGFLSNLNMFGYTDSGYSQGISGVNTGGQFMSSNQSPTTAAPVVSFYPQTTAGATTTVQIPAGETRYFEVRGTVAAGGATSYSVITTLRGDNAYPAVGACTTTVTPCTLKAGSVDVGGGSGSTQNFIWATNATTTTSAGSGTGDADNNWTNGYGLQGLPASGVIQTRSN